ncbi:hypothetical protein FOMPIDRAFT_1157008 [Fomitopsis schrenkii]|uniref:CUE domain-containing protein n=1 Tax=Fomitopsis schrenkii TaxID=2126942 RepID=S8FU56_FOMSC|nr:hypothetical protein FOMPIDRAFT_1157008 [Fomitopsis schrenkii]
MSSDTTAQEPPAAHDAQATTTEPPPRATAEHAEEEETPALPPRLDSRTDAPVEPLAERGHGTPAQTENEHEHPQVALLRGMFPDFDNVILQSVLESVNYDQDRAIDVLLGMSDPNYVSSATIEEPQIQQHDLALDEQLARQLALEDQQQPRHASGTSWPRRGDVPYEARRQGPNSQQQQQQQEGYVTGSERGDFQEFQETLGRMAESGKRTFSSIVTKAKAKINELNEQYQQRQGQPSGAPTSQGGYGAQPSVDRHAASQAVAQQYYGSRYTDPPTEAAPPITLHSQQPPASYAVRGYDVGSGAPPQTSVPAPSSPPATSRISMSPRPSGEVPRPPPTSTGSPGPIDGAKLGLLPKRPVSLLTPQPSAPLVQRQRSEDSELEYVENPFEEGEGRH